MWLAKLEYLIIFLSLTVDVKGQAIAPNDCPSGTVPHLPHICYRPVQRTTNFLDAIRACKGLGLELMPIQKLRYFKTIVNFPGSSNGIFRVNGIHAPSKDWFQYVGEKLLKISFTNWPGFDPNSISKPGDTLLWHQDFKDQLYLYPFNRTTAINGFVLKPLCYSPTVSAEICETKFQGCCDNGDCIGGQCSCYPGWDQNNNCCTPTLNVDPKISAAIAELQANVLQTVAPKGQEFPKIDGPKCLTSKIGIVGAGPAGIHMAYELKKRGFKDVTIFEKNNYVGGKSINLKFRGIMQGLTTALISSDFKDTVIPLLKQFGLFENATFPALKNIANWPKNNDQVPPLSLTEESISYVIQNLGATDPTSATLMILEAAQRYVTFHKDLFGSYDFELMRRPTKSTLLKLGGSVSDFIQRNNFEALRPSMITILTLSGYGNLNSVPALYSLIFVTPQLILDFLVVTENVQLVLGDGIPGLWPLLLKAENIPVKLNFEVKDIKKLPSKKIRLSSFDENEEFDFVMWSGLPQNLDNVASSLITSEQVFRNKDRKFFKSSKTHPATVSLVNMETTNRTSPLQKFTKNLLAPFNNDVMGDFDTHAVQAKITLSDYASKNYQINGQDPTVQTVTVLQYGNRDSVPSQEELYEKLITHYEAFDGTNIEIINQWKFKYSPRWSIIDTANGFHWDVFSLQGTKGMWFIGSGVCHEKVKSVMEYNRLLLQQMNPPTNNC